jgi:hypothetical protein
MNNYQSRLKRVTEGVECNECDELDGSICRGSHDIKYSYLAH